LIGCAKIFVVHDEGSGEFEVYLAHWPDSTTQVLHNQFKTISASINEKMGDVRDMTPMDAMRQIREIVRGSGNRFFLKDFQLTQAVKDRIDTEINVVGKNIGDPWKYDHILDGFKGRQYEFKNPEAPHEEKILEYEDIIKIWALNRRATALMSRKQRA